jgi:hypothetical protein
MADADPMAVRLLWGPPLTPELLSSCRLMALPWRWEITTLFSPIFILSSKKAIRDSLKMGFDFPEKLTVATVLPALRWDRGSPRRLQGRFASRL